MGGGKIKEPLPMNREYSFGALVYDLAAYISGQAGQNGIPIKSSCQDTMCKCFN
jgi:hypothetical protein